MNKIIHVFCTVLLMPHLLSAQSGTIDFYDDYSLIKIPMKTEHKKIANLLNFHKKNNATFIINVSQDEDSVLNYINKEKSLFKKGFWIQYSSLADQYSDESNNSKFYLMKNECNDKLDKIKSEVFDKYIKIYEEEHEKHMKICEEEEYEKNHTSFNNLMKTVFSEKNYTQNDITNLLDLEHGKALGMYIVCNFSKKE